MSKLMVVEWPDGLQPHGAQWEQIAEQVNAVRPDLLLTNEMPFGNWGPNRSVYQPDSAKAWVELHERGVEALSSLSVGAILSSRPVPTERKLANEAFSIVGGDYRAVHHKQLFPEEAGWYEASWFEAEIPDFAIHEVAGLRVAFLVCTELMFNEHARKLGRAGADLIAVPRATGSRRDSWEIAARMAALVGGCYVATSNRVGRATVDGPVFGGYGFIVAPDGTLAGATDAHCPMNSLDLDLSLPAAAKHDYPCYVHDSQSVNQLI